MDRLKASSSRLAHAQTGHLHSNMDRLKDLKNTNFKGAILKFTFQYG